MCSCSKNSNKLFSSSLSEMRASRASFRPHHSTTRGLCKPFFLQGRIPQPRYHYYGKEVWEAAIAALLCGENLLLAGSKATGKNGRSPVRFQRCPCR